MKSFETSTQIQAHPDTIWKILTDANHYPEWDTDVDHIDGDIVPNGKVTIYTKLSPDRAFPVKVTEFVPGKRMTWVGGMPLGLFKGIRTFKLILQTNGSVKVTVRKEFSGLLLPLFANTLPDMNQVFTKFLENLKSKAEHSS